MPTPTRPRKNKSGSCRSISPPRVLLQKHCMGKRGGANVIGIVTSPSIRTVPFTHRTVPDYAEECSHLLGNGACAHDAVLYPSFSEDRDAEPISCVPENGPRTA